MKKSKACKPSMQELQEVISNLSERLSVVEELLVAESEDYNEPERDVFKKINGTINLVEETDLSHLEFIDLIKSHENHEVFQGTLSVEEDGGLCYRLCVDKKEYF